MNTNLFGTDGIRTTVGTTPFTHENLPRMGHAIAQWALSNYGANLTVLIGHDTRASCAYIKAHLLSALLSYPITIIDAATAPTPLICKLLAEKHCDLGIIISASHNPYQDNGIKIIDRNRGKISEYDEQMISQFFMQYRFPSINYNQLGTWTPYLTAQDDYSAQLKAYIPPDTFSGMKIVLDCANGATYQIAPRIFQELGADVIAINTHPDGTNINHKCGAVHPEQLQNTVLAHQADMGFAFDGDGDRVITVSRNGEIKDGDDALALLSTHPRYKDETTLVGTIMTNHGLIAQLEQQQKRCIRTSVGDKYVSERMIDEQLLLGGEQSGHIIMRDYLATGDGIFSALRIGQVVKLTGNFDMHTFTHYPQVLINVPVKIKKNLEQEPLATIIAAYQNQVTHGRIVVRYSGTENILRVMIEDKEYSHAHYLGTQLAHELQSSLQKD